MSAELLDANNDARVNLADCVYLLNHLFKGWPPHILGVACVRIEGYPGACRP